MKGASDEVGCIPGRCIIISPSGWKNADDAAELLFTAGSTQGTLPSGYYYPNCKKILETALTLVKEQKASCHGMPMHETRPIINMILDTSLTLCKHEKKLKASRQLSEEIFRLHFIIFHYHCFTDASGKLAKQIFGKSWEFGPTGLTPPLPPRTLEFFP